MENKINSKLKNKIDSLLSFIKKIGLTDYEQQIIYNEIYSSFNLEQMNSDAFRQNYTMSFEQEQEFNSFITYLYEKYNIYGIDYFRDAIKYAFTYKDDNSNFLDKFIKFVLITNFDDLKIDIKEEDELIHMYVRLGGLPVSHCRSMQYNREQQQLECEWFHNRKGLTRTKLGSYLIVNLLKMVKENMPGVSLISYNVRKKNTVGLNFYNKFGFEIIDYNPDGTNYMVRIPTDKIDECILKNDNQYPTLLFDGKNIDYMTYKKELNSKKSL